MISYREFITEAQQEKSVFEALFYREGPPLFLTPTLLKRLQMSIPNVTAYHVTEPFFIEDLVKSQRSNKSISTSIFTGYHNMTSGKNQIFGGIETDGGMVLELEGTALLRSPADAFTARLKGGRRSVPVSQTSDFFRAFSHGLETKAYEDMEESIISLSTKLNLEVINSVKKQKKRFEQIEKKIENSGDKFDEVNADNLMVVDNLLELLSRPVDAIRLNLPHVGSLIKNLSYKMGRAKAKGYKSYDPLIREMGKIMRDIVSDYMDGMEKIIGNNKSYKMIFMSPRVNTSKIYDEVVLNQYTIKALSFASKQTVIDYYRTLIYRDEEEKRKHDEVDTAGKPIGTLNTQLYNLAIEYFEKKLGIKREMIVSPSDMMKRMSKTRSKMRKVFS